MKLILIAAVICLCLSAAAVAASRDAGGINRFGFRVLAEMDEGKNLMISPVSLEMALGSLQGAAAAGEKQKIAGVLGMGETALNALNKKLLEETSELKNIDLEIANSLWLDRPLAPSPLYRKFIERYYRSQVENLDFADAAAAARRINDWCSDKTRGMVPSPVSPTQLTGSSLVLVNAVYFKAMWTDPFKFQDTYKEVFHPYDKPEYQVWMMHRSGHMRVYRDDSCCAVSLPYADGEFAMDIVVPSDRKVMKEYLAGLKESGRSPFFDEDFGSEELVELSMPVFEAESSVNLTELLKRCGIPMSGYTRMLTAGKPVDISEVLQSVKVKADEKGTEAAAVTTVTMGLIAMNVMPVEIDRPFIFTIYDTKKGTVYFAGVIYTPDEAVGKRKAPGSPAAGGKDGDGPEMLVAPPLGM